ncbi:unnamed protein product [Chilo suppressalis]|uniref:Uncharacterized protein n=1 Tax=Chilo suppressalis TaxID=168631 RepID=A0ABN8B011_CHISP|nr:unnamed protein product [Chilo suppressalis]
MWIFLMLFGAVISEPVDEVMNLINEKEILRDHGIRHIIPEYVSPELSDKKDIQFLDLFSNKDNKLYNTFNNYVEKGATSKGLTFNIYDDELRNAAIALFRLLTNSSQTDKNNFDKLKKWAKDNVNDDLLDYALHLTNVFGNTNLDAQFLPPFIYKPNFFVSGDAIIKALKYLVNDGEISEDIKKTYQILNIDKNTTFINANYSLCSIEQELCKAQIKYFTEDVALNSYYYGLHLLHPFWMSDEELNKANPNHAANYYFAHQQLFARYLLEKENIDPNIVCIESSAEPNFQPNLYYENGLPFPTRTSILGRAIRTHVTFLQNIDMTLTECIQRGIVKVENGSWIKVTEENSMNLVAKFIRSEIEDVMAAKIIRSVFGYATNGYPIHLYNPAPSVMHHPQTALRDPVSWYLIKRIVDYYVLYTNNTKSYDLSKYERSDYTIANLEVTRITTIFNYYMINLYKSFGEKANPVNSTNIFARQRRLNHEPFKVILTVHSKIEKDVIIRIFIGPECSIMECWDMHIGFFQLDCYRYRLIEGFNIVTWTPDTSLRYSSDQQFNYSVPYDSVIENYDIFKFPKNLAIPKGREQGVNFTMFVMILEDEESHDDFKESSIYKKITDEISNKPLGFPFHRKADIKSVNDNAPNYKFQNITVFHIKDPVDDSGYFSPYLY